MYHLIEDTKHDLALSAEEIQSSIVKLGARIDKQFKSLGEFMSKEFAWFKILIKYKDAIENLNYFHSISGQESSTLQTNLNIVNLTSLAQRTRFSLNEEKDVARFLLSPTGIQKWLYQINFLITGRRGSEFNSHAPIIFWVMEKYKKELCTQHYKDHITRSYRQLMLLQLQGYILWSKAYSIADRDSRVYI